MVKPKPMVADAEALKKQARANLVRPQYNVFDDYWDTGVSLTKDETANIDVGIHYNSACPGVYE